MGASGLQIGTPITPNATCLSAYNAWMLSLQNVFRAKHGVVLLMPNASITAIAQAYATKMALNRTWAHSGVIGLGENLASKSSTNGAFLGNCTGLAVTFVNMWYNEINNYVFTNPGFAENTGHFTQVSHHRILKHFINYKHIYCVHI